MIRFALCDYNEIQLAITGEILRGCLEPYAGQVSIIEFSSGEALLADVRKNGGYDAYILDMIMPGMNGMEVASTLRLLNDTGKIIFLTSTSDYAVQAFDVKAYHYILKPLDSAKFAGVMKTLMDDIARTGLEVINIKTQEGDVAVKLQDIVHTDVQNRYPIYNLRNGKQITGKWLRTKFKDEVAPLLSKNYFVECGASCVINLCYVESIDSECVVMTDGSVIYPPQSAIYTIMKQWMDFKKKK